MKFDHRWFPHLAFSGEEKVRKGEEEKPSSSPHP